MTGSQGWTHKVYDKQFRNQS